MQLVVMFPDHKALGCVDFVRQITRVVPDAIVRPILNGLTDTELDAAAMRSEGDPIIAHGAQGLRSTLSAGYEAIRWHHSHGTLPIVRLDTAEHPPEVIPDLARAAIECRGMAIGDLTFDEHTLREGSVDAFAHLHLFPDLYRQMTGGQLSLSCAHGFQAFAPGVMDRVFEQAMRIVTWASFDASEPIEWGFDGAMALAAVGLGIPIVVQPVRATVLRDRETAKIAQQFRRALQMCPAARTIFPQLGS